MVTNKFSLSIPLHSSLLRTSLKTQTEQGLNANCHFNLKVGIIKCIRLEFAPLVQVDAQILGVLRFSTGESLEISGQPLLVISVAALAPRYLGCAVGSI